MYKKNLEIRLIQGCVIASIFSQIESISIIMRPIMSVMWILAVVFYLIKYRGRVFMHGSTKIYTICYSLLLLESIIITLAGFDHLNGNYINIMYIPLLASIVAEYFSQKPIFNKNGLRTILITYLVGAVIYGLWVNVTYFPSYSDWLKQNIYTFMLKNSAAQIWSTGILIAVFLIDYETKLQRIIGYVAIIYLVFLCGISQCRTAILALGIVIIIYILLKSKQRLLWLLLITLLGILIWNIPFTRGFINQALFLTKYAGTDLNTFSSGRLDGWGRAIDNFVQYPFFGTGKYYVDCSYISILTETGIFGFILIETIWLFRILTNLIYSKGCNIGTFLLCITIFYFVESVLEGYPPFGPGVSSFMFWFLSVILVKGYQKSGI